MKVSRKTRTNLLAVIFLLLALPANAGNHCDTSELVGETEITSNELPCHGENNTEKEEPNHCENCLAACPATPGALLTDAVGTQAPVISGAIMLPFTRAAPAGYSLPPFRPPNQI